MTTKLVDFYLDRTVDSTGRSIAQIWSWNHDKLEYCHDFIQWLFPLRKSSNFNLNAPCLTDADIQTFQSSDELKNRLLRSLHLMLDFYGLAITDPSLTIARTSNFSKRARNWLDRGNHNHLRITRILKCLMLLGLPRYAEAFFNCLSEIYQDYPNQISNRSFAFWRSAIDC